MRVEIAELRVAVNRGRQTSVLLPATAEAKQTGYHSAAFETLEERRAGRAALGEALRPGDDVVRMIRIRDASERNPLERAAGMMNAGDGSADRLRVRVPSQEPGAARRIPGEPQQRRIAALPRANALFTGRVGAETAVHDGEQSCAMVCRHVSSRRRISVACSRLVTPIRDHAPRRRIGAGAMGGGEKVRNETTLVPVVQQRPRAHPTTSVPLELNVRNGHCPPPRPIGIATHVEVAHRRVFRRQG